MRVFMVVALLLISALAQTSPPASSPADQFSQLSFLEGTWQAKTQGGSAGAATAGTYTFQRELNGHVLARHTLTSPGCRGPAAFDCAHTDLLYVYPGSAGRALRAIYFDNEGHVIHYGVSVPQPGTAVFLSDAHAPGPQFRLFYTLSHAILSGKFQMRMPGQADWKTYLEWSGPRLRPTSGWVSLGGQALRRRTSS